MSNEKTKEITEIDQFWMEEAIQMARLAERVGEVPVGAILVSNQQIIGRGYNQPIQAQDPTAHAEIMAIRAGAATLQNYRLVDTTLYVTLEPCFMCTGAIIHARIRRLVFGAMDTKSGACGGFINLLNEKQINHRIEYQGGILAGTCSDLLKQFFQKRREIV